MTTSGLFYEQAAPVSSDRHRKLAVERAGYAFARRTNSIPLTTVEFRKAARVYPVVFTASTDVPTPVAIVGLKDRENAFIGDNGDWAAEYIPAFVRRYPFVFASDETQKTFTVCIDEGFAGCNGENRGERLFTEAGERTQYLENMLKFLQQYQVEHQRTLVFGNQLTALDLLIPMQANVALNNGESLSLGGFSIVDESKLRTLPGSELESLSNNGALELIYAHLLSLESFAAMLDRVAGSGADAAPSPSKEASPARQPSPAQKKKRSSAAGSSGGKRSAERGKGGAGGKEQKA